MKKINTEVQYTINLRQFSFLKNPPHLTSPTRGEETFPPLTGGTKGVCYFRFLYKTVVCEKYGLYWYFTKN